MVRRETWIVLILFAALVGLAAFLNRREKQAATAATPTSGIDYVFDQAEGQPTSIEVAPKEGQTVRIERRSDGMWIVDLPYGAASQGLAEAAATQVSTLRLVGEIAGAPEIFGLDQPTHVISVEFSGGERHRLEIGSATPTNSGYYGRLDNEKLLIVGLSGIDGLLNLATAPPFLETPTPSPTSPPTATPAAAGTGTPAP